jgi:hypothetical protein
MIFHCISRQLLKQKQIDDVYGTRHCTRHCARHVQKKIDKKNDYQSLVIKNVNPQITVTPVVVLFSVCVCFLIEAKHKIQSASFVTFF